MPTPQQRLDLKAEILKLPARVVIDRYAIYIDIPRPYVKFPKDGKASLREYLTGLIEHDYEKAIQIVNALKNINSSRDHIYGLLNKKRGLILREAGTTGAQIFKNSVYEIAQIKKPEHKLGFFHESDAKESAVSADQSPTDIPFDADIVSNHSVSVSEYFPHQGINPAEYRRTIYFDIQVNPIGLKHAVPNDIKAVNQQDQKQAAGLPVSNFAIKGAVVGEYVPLLTLTPNDNITNLKANCEIEWGYSEGARQYYIKPKEQPPGGVLYVSYNLHKGIKRDISQVAVADATKQICIQALHGCEFKVSGNKLVLNAGDLNCFSSLTVAQKLSVLTTYFHQFGDQALSRKEAEGSVEAFNLMLKEKKAACRHRVMLCKAFANVLNIPNVNIVASGLHARIEARVGDDVLTADLGGAFTRVVKQKPVPEFENVSLVRGFDAWIMESYDIRKADGRVRINFSDKEFGASEWNTTVFRKKRLQIYIDCLSEVALNKQPFQSGKDNLVYFEFANSIDAARAIEKIYEMEQRTLKTPNELKSIERNFPIILSELDPDHLRVKFAAPALR